MQGASHIQLAYVREDARRHGITKALLRECVADAKARGARTISLEVLTSNVVAVTIWRRLGFTEYSLTLASPIDALEARLDAEPSGVQRASTHVQTDDELSVHRAVAQFVPRPEQPDVSANGSWIRVVDPVFDRDRDAHARFARELSERLGAVTVALAQEGEVVRFRLYERGRMVDEYLSVPDVLRPVAEGRRARAVGEPDARRAPHRRRPRRGSASRQDRQLAGRPAAGARSSTMRSRG